MKPGIAMCVLAAGLAAAGRSGAVDFESVRGHAVSSSEQAALQEAYFSILDRAVTGLAGNQAGGAVGQSFRRDFENDFDGFRERYFTADTDYRCQPRDNGRVACEVVGTLRRAALETVMRKVVRTTEQTLSNTLTFVLSAADAPGRDASFVVDKLSGAFTGAGHRIVTGPAVNAAIGAGKVDFALGIYEVRFSSFEYDSYDQRMSGSLIVRFKLNQPKTGLQIANLPVQVRSQISGTSPDTLKADLVGDLSEKAAREIARKVNESVITTQREKEADVAAQRRATSGQAEYVVRLAGIAKRDREDIRVLRNAIREMYPDAQAAVDPDASDDKRVTLRFSTARKVVPDDLVDRFYAAAAARPMREAEYVGGNEFFLQF